MVIHTTLCVYIFLFVTIFIVEPLSANARHLMGADSIGNDAYTKAGDYKKKALFDSAIFYFQKAATTYRKEKQWEQWIGCYNDLGECFVKTGNYDIALAYIDTARAAIIEKLSEDHLEMANTCNNAGEAYRGKGELEKALTQQKKALEIRRKKLGDNHPLVATSYNNLGITYRENGDFDRALEYYQKALSIRVATLGASHTDVAASYQNMGIVYSEKSDYEQALAYYQKAMEIDKKIYGENAPALSGGYYNMGIAFKEQKDYDKAIAHFEKSLSIDIHIFGEQHPYIAQSYLNMGSVLGAQGKYEAALDYLEKATDICVKNLNANNPLLALVYMETGRLYSLQKNYEKALFYYQQALITIVPNFDEPEIYANPGFENVNTKRLLLVILGLKAESLGQQTSIAALQAAMKTYDLALDLITNLRTGYEAAGSKYYLSSEATKIYNKAIPTALKLSKISGNEKYKYDAFLLAERNKAGILIETLTDLEAKKSVGVPDSVFSIEREVDNRIAFLKKESQKLNSAFPADSIQFEAYQRELFALKTRKTELIASIQRTYPRYYELKYDMPPVDVTHFQNHYLEPGQALLSYFSGSNSLHIFGLTQRHLAHVSLPKSKNFDAQILTLLKAISSRDYESFTKNAYATYQTLLASILPKITNDNIHISQLTIIPDGILGYVPFETLIQKPASTTDGYKDLSYLLKDYQISYHYTANLLTMEHALPGVSSESFIGFAPTFRDDTGQQWLAFNETVRSYIDSARALPYAKEEVNNIAALLGGTAHLGAKATEKTFKQNAGRYNIIHLASHSLVDDADPLYSKLIFDNANDNIEDGLLHTYELYNMQLNADLVTLSACNTGVGKYYKGEGIVSLARGFMYAGVPNVMMSLWSVADRPTKDIMQHFYEALNTGIPYASALHKAKLHYLENADNITADPYYWGAFIYLGQPIDHAETGTKTNKWITSGILIILLIIGSITLIGKKTFLHSDAQP